jgi:hypothetical protein
MADRTGKGQFVKGRSGSPAGRRLRARFGRRPYGRDVVTALSIKVAFRQQCLDLRLSESDIDRAQVPALALR